jgi:Flp pilus assembly protein TadG
MTFISTNIPSFARFDDGAGAVEFALTASIFFPVLVGTIAFAQAVWTKNSLQYAVEETARCRAINASVCPDDASAATFGASQMLGIQIDASAFAVTHPSCGIQVSASVPFSFGPIIPSFTVNATTCRPV